MTPACLVARAGPCDAESPATREDDHAVLMLASTPYNRHGSARFDVQKSYADTPTLIIGTHFAGPTAGHLVRDGDAYRLAV